MVFQFKRRTLIGAGLSAAFAGSLISLPRWIRNSPWRFFTPEEARTVEAICAQLIPTDRTLALGKRVSSYLLISN